MNNFQRNIFRTVTENIMPQCYYVIEGGYTTTTQECLGATYNHNSSSVTVNLNEVATQNYGFTITFSKSDCLNAMRDVYETLTIFAGSSSATYNYVADTYSDCGQGSCGQELATYIGITSTDGLTQC